MALSKSARFAIFRRDAFTCQYCGRKPPSVVLEVDHIYPKAEGGDEDEMNLVTSCMDCNRGKSDTVLNENAPRPDADLAWLEMQQEMAELRRYNEAKAERDQQLRIAVELLQYHWAERIPASFSVESDQTMMNWMVRFGPDEVEYAIDHAAIALSEGRINSDDHLRRYALGILWKRKKGG